MSIDTGNRGIRVRVATIITVLTLLLAPGVAVAQESVSSGISEQQATFPVMEPPEAPFSAHQSMLRFTPGAAAPLHHHGGPGYITILEGELTLYENGEESVYTAGDSFVETPDHEYWGGNFSDQDMFLMVTYLVPEGNEVTTTIDSPDAPETPDVGPETLAERVYEFANPPESFALIHTVRTFEPGATTGDTSADGDILETVVGGTLAWTAGDQVQTLESGHGVMMPAGQQYALTNESDERAVTMSTELAPNAYSMAPETGGIVDRTMAMWLFIMTATGVLIVGGILRLGVISPRAR